MHEPGSSRDARSRRESEIDRAPETTASDPGQGVARTLFVRMRRLAPTTLAILAALAPAGCGGGSDDASRETTGDTSANQEGSRTLTAPSWAVPYFSKAGPEGAAIMASSDYAVGSNRVSFLLVRDDNSLVRVPATDVYYRPVEDGPVKRSVARLVPIGAGDSKTAADEVKEIYVVTLDLPRAGKHWFVAQPRGVRFQGFQILEVKDKPDAVAIGERAPASENPTTATEPAARITTARPPDVALLEHSVADSIAAGIPFVVAFATPTYCESRTCGPTVAVVEAARRRYEQRGIRFIHVEIYEGNNPANGVNRWVKEWRLSTEPWVFVVDRNGVVRDRFEGAVSVAELEKSIRGNLMD